MFTGLQGQKILYTTSFVEKVCRKILVSIRAILLECLGWLCMTLHFSFPSIYKARYKSTFWKIKLLGLAEAWSPRVFSSLYLSLSLPLPLFFRLIPWSMGAPCVHLSARVFKTWMGRLSASSLPQETGRAPVASVNRANFLSWSFIDFLCKPKNISFSPLFSYLQHSYLSLSLNQSQSPTPFLLRVSLDPAGAGPRQEWVAISFSNTWKWKVKGKLLIRVRLFATPWTRAYQAPLSMAFSRQEQGASNSIPAYILSA